MNTKMKPRVNLVIKTWSMSLPRLQAPRLPVPRFPVMDWTPWVRNLKRIHVVLNAPIHLRATSRLALNAAAVMILILALPAGIRFGEKAKLQAQADRATAQEIALLNAHVETPGVIAESPIASIEKKLEAEIKGIPGVEAMIQEEGSKAIKVTLSTDSFFQIGTANLEGKSEPSLKELAGVLKNVLSKMSVEIQGHTDDSPILKQKRLYRSNWELSLARAASLVHVFEDVGFVKDQLKVVGYGDSRPMLPNRTPSGEAIVSNLTKNRRIVLRITEGGSP